MTRKIKPIYPGHSPNSLCNEILYLLDFVRVFRVIRGQLIFPD